MTHVESWALDLKREALESLSIGVGGTKVAAIWDVIVGAFALRSEPVIHPYADYSSTAPSKDPFNAVDPAPAIGCPLGYDVAAAPGYKPVDHIEAALHQMQIGVDPVNSHDALGPLLVSDDPANPASCVQVKATVAKQWRAACGLPACVCLVEATLAYPVSKEKTCATRISQRYLSKQMTALSPKDSWYTCTFEGCDRIFKQLAGVYNHLCCLHLRVAVGCYYCSGHWWTSKGWSDHHIREHPWSDPYPSAVTMERLLVKKVQAPTTVDSEAAFTAPSADDFFGKEAQSSTSIVDDKEDDVPPFPSSSLHDAPSAAPIADAAEPSPEGFGGAHPRIPTAAVGSGHHKKALPHHSTCAWTFTFFHFDLVYPCL